MRRLDTVPKAIRSLLPGFILLLAVPSASPEAGSPGATVASPRSGSSTPRIAYGARPLSFEANRGQTDPAVKFLARSADQIIFLTSTEAVSVLTQREGSRGKATRTVLTMKVVGATPEPVVAGQGQLEGKANYFIGKDPSQWRTGVPTYAKVQYADIYRGIDLVYHGAQRQLEYDFIVRPGADPATIRLSFAGAEKLEVNPDGDLMLRLAGGTLRHRKPVIYQEVDGARREIAGGWVLKGAHEVGFRVAAYDREQPLVIDPVLAYSTFLGGTDVDGGSGIAVDRDGNAYVTGFTASTDFPTTAAFQPGVGGADDVFVTKLNSTGTALVYSTYLGGDGDDLGLAIAVDASGHAYVTGETDSPDFPTTTGAFQTGPAGGGSDAVVVKLNPTGGLAYSTYLSSIDFERGLGIAVDATGHAYVTGETFPARSSTGVFPTTEGALDRVLSGFFDGFVTKLNPAGTALVYSTYLGGDGDDLGLAIAVDASGHAYVTGQTESGDFPTTEGAFDRTLEGIEGFVTKLNPAGAALVYSTYLGGSGGDVFHVGEPGTAIAVDATGHAYITGITDSRDFPTTEGAFDRTLGGLVDAYVTKLSPAGTALVYSTYLGGAGDDEFGLGIALDSAGHAYVTGHTDSPDFPTMPGAFQTGGLVDAFVPDAFVTKLNPTGTALVYSTYLGGRLTDRGLGIAVDAAGNAYVTGDTDSTDFMTTPGAFQTAANPLGEAFVAKITDISLERVPPVTTASASPAPNGGGWSRTNVTVTLTARDNSGGSGVQGIEFTLAGAQSGGAVVAKDSHSVTITAEGTTTLTYFARDVAGNQESPQTLTVRIDKTAPAATAALVPVGRVKDDEGRFRVQIGCNNPSGASAAGTATAKLNGIAVSHGQVVELELDDETEVEVRRGILRELEGPSFSLVVSCPDAAGNVGTKTAAPVFADRDSKKKRWRR